MSGFARALRHCQQETVIRPNQRRPTQLQITLTATSCLRYDPGSAAQGALRRWLERVNA